MAARADSIRPVVFDAFDSNRTKQATTIEHVTWVERVACVR